MLARGAQPIVDARLAGKRPAHLVLVSMIGWLEEKNPVVIVQPGQQYDWWWVKGLQMCLVTQSGLPWRNMAEQILRCGPRDLILWDAENLQGAWVYRLPTLESLERGVGAQGWVWKLDILPWLPTENYEFAQE